MTETKIIKLPRRMERLDGGQTDEMVLREPELRHLLVAEKLLEQDRSLAQQRARDIKLISIIADIKEEELRTLPVSIQAQAMAYLGTFINAECNHDDRDASLLIHFATPVKHNGIEYGQLMLEEPTTGTVEAAEKQFAKGVNDYSLRLYQQTLIMKSGDLPGSAVPFLPVRVVDRAALYLSRFTKAGPATGAN